MKTAKEWHEQFSKPGSDFPTPEQAIEMIQRDALASAAEICQKRADDHASKEDRRDGFGSIHLPGIYMEESRECVKAIKKIMPPSAAEVGK